MDKQTNYSSDIVRLPHLYTPEAIHKGRKKHGVQAVMLADPDLEVTTRYNLRNERSLAPKGLTTLPIPTTFLVSADGIVRWIDQAVDYQVRSDPTRVLSAIRANLH